MVSISSDAPPLFSSTPLISKGVEELKNGDPIPMNQFSVSVTSAGFKPATVRAEI